MNTLILTTIPRRVNDTASLRKNLRTENLFSQFGKYSNVFCQNTFIKNRKYPEVLNKYSLGALDNYAQHENVDIYIRDMSKYSPTDVIVSVLKGNTGKGKSFSIDLKPAKENFADVMRRLYSNIEDTIQELSKK